MFGFVLKQITYKILYVFPSVVGPIAFCNMVGTEEEDGDESLKGSKRNMDEARKAVSCRLSILQFLFQENISQFAAG